MATAGPGFTVSSNGGVGREQQRLVGVAGDGEGRAHGRLTAGVEGVDEVHRGRHLGHQLLHGLARRENRLQRGDLLVDEVLGVRFLALQGVGGVLDLGGDAIGQCADLVLVLGEAVLVVGVQHHAGQRRSHRANARITTLMPIAVRGRTR